MTTREIEKAHKSQPFRPFRLHLAGGRRLDVKHPELMAYVPGGRTTVVYKADGNFEIIDLLLIEAIEVLAGRGGAARRRRSA